MSYWVDMYMRHEQMIDRRQQAARHRLVRQTHRLVRQAKSAGPGAGRAYAPLMAFLGRQLTLWGTRLETQYDL